MGQSIFYNGNPYTSKMTGNYIWKKRQSVDGMNMKLDIINTCYYNDSYELHYLTIVNVYIIISVTDG